MIFLKRGWFSMRLLVLVWVLLPLAIASKYKLAALIMARNECPSWAEWLAHYRFQGFDHFYVIDNNSTDNCDMGALGPDVTVWHWYPRPSEDQPSGNQDTACTHHLPDVDAEWTALVDIDEYLFGVKESLLGVVEKLPDSVSQLCIPWFTFGSSGHKIQPACVASSNVYRRSVVSEEGIGKCIQRTERVLHLHTHRPTLINETWKHRGSGCICPDLRTRCTRAGFTSKACPLPRHGEALNSRHVRNHHYVSQSTEQMRRKQNRGDADIMKHRSQLYWQRMEWYSNRDLDTTLRNISLANRLCTPSADDPPLERIRPLERDSATGKWSWNTWDGLSVYVNALGGDILNFTKGRRRAPIQQTNATRLEGLRRAPVAKT